MVALPANLFGSFAGIFGTLLKVILAALVLGMIGVFVYFFIFKNKAYDTRVIILSVRSGKIQKLYYDRARFLKNKDTGANEIHLLKSKAKVPTVDYESLIINKRGQSILVFRETADNVLYPVKDFTFPSDGALSMSAVPNDLALLAAAEKKYTRSIYDKPKPWEKILPLMVIGTTGIFVVILVWFVMRDIKTVATALQGVTQVCQAAANVA